MFQRLSRLPPIYDIVTGLLLVALVVGGAVHDDERTWPLGLPTLLGLGVVFGLAALFKRAELGRPPKPFDAASPRHRSTLHGRIIDNRGLITSPYTGREYVVLGFGVRIGLRGATNMARGVPFRVLRDDGTTVTIYMPGQRDHYQAGARTPIGESELSPEARAFWEETWPRTYGGRFEDPWLRIAYEYGFCEGDRITIIGSFLPRQAADGSVAYEPRQGRGHPHVIIASVPPSKVPRLAQTEINFMLAVTAPVLLFAEVLGVWLE